MDARPVKDARGTQSNCGGGEGPGGREVVTRTWREPCREVKLKNVVEVAVRAGSYDGQYMSPGF